jgi:hypothetical protein
MSFLTYLSQCDADRETDPVRRAELQKVADQFADMEDREAERLNSWAIQMARNTNAMMMSLLKPKGEAMFHATIEAIFTRDFPNAPYGAVRRVLELIDTHEDRRERDINRAVSAEREACASLAYSRGCHGIASSIRSRGESQ